MSLVNRIPELDGTNYGKWYQKLEIALAMGNIDLDITTTASQEPEKPVRERMKKPLLGLFVKRTMTLLGPDLTLSGLNGELQTASVS